ncbi:MBL fold metallo-hydrolase [Spirochaetia bacterium]|nr:MBL fold metallo-hydrolase [Spirochaetia bacterium]
MKITVLGSGTSHGIPVIGCHCRVCASDDSRDKRLRASLYIEGDSGEAVVIDTGPDFRLQALQAGIEKLDAIFLTHDHADHLHGLDDVRTLSQNKPLPVYGNEKTIAELRERFSYIFKETQQGGGKPRIIPQVLSGPIQIGGLSLSPLPVLHGTLEILGWKVQQTPAGHDGAAVSPALVYLTDTSAIPEGTWPLIGQPEILILDGLRLRPHVTHFSIPEALDAAVKTGARRTYLTHICHDLSHAEIEEYCCSYRKEHHLEAMVMEPAYDGLQMEIGPYT